MESVSTQNCNFNFSAQIGKTKLLISFLEAVEISFYVPLNFIAYYVETEKFFKSDDYIRELKEEF